MAAEGPIRFRRHYGPLLFFHFVIIVQTFFSLPLSTSAAPITNAAELEEPDSFRGRKLLFNGRDLSGWRFIGKGDVGVKDGYIQAGGKNEGLLYWTGGKLGRCIIRVVFSMQHENDNSGVFIRIPIEPREIWMPTNYGYEVQIDNHPERSGENEYHVTGTLYSLTKPLAKPGKPGPQWNVMEITLNGPRTIVVLNGVKVTDYSEGDPVPERVFFFEPLRGPRPEGGWLALQCYDHLNTVFFKEVSVKTLP